MGKFGTDEEGKLEMLQLSASKRPWYMPKVAAINYLNVLQGHKSRLRSSKVLLVQRLH